MEHTEQTEQHPENYLQLYTNGKLNPIKLNFIQMWLLITIRGGGYGVPFRPAYTPDDSRTHTHKTTAGYSVVCVIASR